MNETFSQILKQVYLGNSVQAYLIALATFLIALILFYIVRVVILSKLSKLSKLTKFKYDEIIIRHLRLLKTPDFVIFSIYIAAQSLTIAHLLESVISGIFTILIAYHLVKMSYDLIREFITAKISGDEHVDPARVSASKNILILINWGIWIAATLFVLNNLGFNITTAIAGLGIGGVAVALAAQSILKDAFCSLTIYLDKPFVVGDFIIVGDKMGVVEHIGIKTTRVRSLQGEQLVFANGDLTDSRIQNFKRMEMRRVPFSIGVVYGTPLEKLKRIPMIIKEIVVNHKDATFDRAHFKSYGDYNLEFEIVYFVHSNDYNKYMDINENINLAIYEAFEKEKIEFAFPTQTIFMNKE
ncbi:MAG: mechanosensitive ion channel family protein [Pseudomonadota bacterium]